MSKGERKKTQRENRFGDGESHWQRVQSEQLPYSTFQRCAAGEDGGVRRCEGYMFPSSETESKDVFLSLSGLVLTCF